MIRPDGTVSDAILTTLTPSDRVPSVGTQELLPLAPLSWQEKYERPTKRTDPAPERLTLWDQTASLEL